MKQISLAPLKKFVTKKVSIPGSKSYTNRALVLGALCDAPVRLVNPLFSDDTEAMVECLRVLGIGVEVVKKDLVQPSKLTGLNQLPRGYITINGSIADVRNKEYRLNCRFSGTTIRFITALSVLVPGTKIIYGEKRLNERPIGDLVDGLRQLGAQIEYEEKEGYPPVRVESKIPLLTNGSPPLEGVKKITIPGATSSQFLSALLMVAPLIGNLAITIKGAQISASYIDITLDIMRQFSVDVEHKGYKDYYVKGGQRYILPAGAYTIEGDYSAAAYFFAIAALTKSTITVQNLNPRSVQGDRLFLDVLKKMGSTFTFIPPYKGGAREGSVTIHGKGVKPLPKVDMLRMPDQAQTLAVLAAFAKGKTTLTGIRSLRIKETERVQALQTELAKMGIKTQSTSDTLTIYGGNPRPATIDTYNDHRMAMSFAVAGAKLKGMQINNPEVVQKTFPQFWEVLVHIGMGNSLKYLAS